MLAQDYVSYGREITSTESRRLITGHFALSGFSFYMFPWSQGRDNLVWLPNYLQLLTPTRKASQDQTMEYIHTQLWQN